MVGGEGQLAEKAKAPAANHQGFGEWFEGLAMLLAGTRVIHRH
jgi:hypothetical protein